MDENKKNDTKTERNENIKDFGAVQTFGGKHKIFCLTIIGEIEGHNVLSEQTKTTKYEHVIPQLIAVEESEEIEGVLIIVNTVGGDVSRSCFIRADFRYEKADGFVCFGRRTFNRSSFKCCY